MYPINIELGFNVFPRIRSKRISSSIRQKCLSKRNLFRVHEGNMCPQSTYMYSTHSVFKFHFKYSWNTCNCVCVCVCVPVCVVCGTISNLYSTCCKISVSICRRLFQVLANSAIPNSNIEIPYSYFIFRG